MLLRGIRHKAPDDRRPVPCLAQVTLNSARRRPLRQTGPLVIEGPVSSARARIESHVIGHIRGALPEEDHMTTTIFWVMALLAMSCAIGSVNERQHFATVSLHRGRR